MSEWISVKDRLPDIGQRILAYRPTAKMHSDDEITTCVYTGEMRKSFEGIVHGFDRINHPTHWMPLPDAPK